MIGGGIAGTVTAMALRRAGWRATVFEAHHRGADGVGAFLTLATNGLAALRTLDLDHLVGGYPTPDIEIRSSSGRVLGRAGLGPEAGLVTGTVTRTVARSELYVALRDEAARRGVEMAYGRRLVDAQSSDDGVSARFADGTAAEGDLLVGADGLHSRVRTLVDPAAPAPRYLGLLNTGGYARGVDTDAEPGVLHMVFGRHCFVGYSVAPDGSVWWFANPPSPTEPATLPGPDVWRAELTALLAPDGGPGAALVAATDVLAGPWPTYDLPHVPEWHRDRMVLLGDAAHAASPASGQGASMALEDAVAFGRCVRDLPNVPRAFAAYEALRRARVERVVAHGRRNGDGKSAGPVGRLVRDTVLRLVLRGQRGPRWLYAPQPVWDDAVAVSGADRAA